MFRHLFWFTALIMASSAQVSLGTPHDKLLPGQVIVGDGATADQFGYSVGISGDTVIVGSPYRNGGTAGATDAGGAYLYDAGLCEPIGFLAPDDTFLDDRAGISVDVSGETAVVGVFNDNGSSTGAAYIFDVDTQAQLFKLFSNDIASGDHFGQTVAISGDVVIVGALGDDDNGSSSGSAYLFDATSGNELFKLLSNDGAIGDQFGWSVDVFGDIAIVGTPFHDGNSGAAYLFDVNTGAQLFKLLPDDTAPNDVFGNAVGIHGEVAIVGARQNPELGVGAGAAYLFDVNTGAQLFKLLADDGAALDFFGKAVDIIGPTAVVGAHKSGDNGVDSGSAYYFDVQSGTQLRKLLPMDNDAGDLFGDAVAIGRNHAVIGAKFNDDDGGESGSAYVFVAPPCLPADVNNDGVVDTSDLGILLSAFGLKCP